MRKIRSAVYLIPGSSKQGRLALPESTRHVADQAPRIANAGIQARTRNTVANGHVAETIARETPQPAMDAVTSIIEGALLGERR